MCGICGYVDLKKRISANCLRNMNNIASYRGPDDEGYAFFNESNEIIEAKGKDTVEDKIERLDMNSIHEEMYLMGFGHRRLSILDLSSAGHQPMINEDKNIMITFNGEIYNYLEIKNKLQNDGYVFTTNTDTEVIIYAYLKWGEKCVNYFSGMWAFALYDGNEKKFFCSRDRLGVKPFHYYFDNEKFVFASEMKQVIQDLSIRRTLNTEILSTNLVFGLSDYDNQTLLNQIFLLKPGNNMIVTKCGRHLKRREYAYWNLETKATIVEKEDVITQMVGKALEKSIEYRLRSDIPIGGLLSGGLDSSSMLTLVKNMYKGSQTIETFTACYDEAVDEKKYAKVVNEYNGFSANYVYPKCENLKDELSNIIWHCEGNINFEHLGFYKVLEAVQEKGIHVILNGQGGDETLFGYERYYAFYYYDLIKSGNIKKFFTEFYLGIRNSTISLKMMVSFFFYFNFPIIRMYWKKNTASKFLKKDFIKNTPWHKIKQLLFPRSLRELFFNELTATQLPHILRWDDRSYMAFSIESRVPFIDSDFVELASKIPHKSKISQGYTKILLRRYMDDKMPKEITWRKNKMGFSAPTYLWEKQLTKEFYQDVLENSRCEKIFNIKKIKKMIQNDTSNDLLKKFVITELFVNIFDVDII